MKNKLFRKILSVFVFVVGLFSLPIYANAATNHEFSLIGVKCPMDNYTDLDGDDKYYQCMDDYIAGDLDTYVIDSGDDVDPGTVVMVALQYTPGDDMSAVAFNTTLTYDTSIWTSIHTSTSDFYDDSVFPKSGRSTKWGVEMNVPTEGTIRILGADDTNFIPLDTAINLYYIFMQLNDDVTPGKSVSINFGQEAGDTDLSDENSNQLPYTTNDLTLSVYGNQSADASLKTLTVTNDSITYPLSPDFAAGDTTNTTYNTVVPNGITDIDIAAVANNEYAKVTSVTFGEETLVAGNTTSSISTNSQLAVGNNEFKILITSQLGDIETYTVNVYRLSNDATLSSLTLTNDINIEALETGVYSYTANDVPYATKDTQITADPTHDNAFIASGDGTWTFTSAGATPNVQNVIVKAENCLDEYASVEGNSCTSQTYTITVNRIAASTNNYLSSLTVDGVSVPDFNKETITYNLDPVSNATTTLDIAAVVEDTGKANIVSGTGTVNLEIGDNSFDVVVKAEDGSEKTYTINVRRLSSDTKLMSLNVTSNPVGSLTPAFTSSFEGEYTYTYDPTVTSVTVTATVNDTNNAKVFISDTSDGSTPTGTGILNTATNTFTVDTTKVSVVVTAEDGSIQIYPINLNRLKSSNNYLSALSLSEGTLSPDFTSTNRTYTASVDGSVESVEVYATKAVSYSEITKITGNTDLQFGLNTIEVEVTAEDGTPASYIINLTREKYTIATLDDLTVNGITVSGFVPADDTKLEYTIANVPYETTSLTINGTKTNSYSTVTGFKDVSLNTGDNEIIVSVTSHDGNTTNDYIINVYREKNPDNTVHGITVAGVVPEQDADGNYVVTLPNDKETLYPADIVISVGDGAQVIKNTTLPLSTKQVNTYPFSVTSEAGVTEVYNILVTRTKSNDASISKVTLTIGEDSSRYCLMEGDTCTIGVPVDTTGFSLSADIHSEATVSPENGTAQTMTASESTKNVVLTVTAEDGTEKEYTVVVERQKSSNNNLKDLQVDGVTVNNFVAGTQIYYVTVPGTTEEILVSAEVEDTGKATITTDLTNKFTLDFGRNQIDVEVKAENDDTKKYTLIVTRQNRIDATLKDLQINGVTITGFNSGITEYLLNDVDYDVTQLEVLATPNDELATASGDGTITLTTGENEIIITVTAHDTSVTKPYTIKVTRTKNNDTGIQSIEIEGVTATYNSETGNYEATVPNDITEASSANVSVVVNDPATENDKKATYTVTTTELLTGQDNIVPITVTAEDGTVGTYNLVVTRTSSDDTSISKVILTIGDDSSRYCLMEGDSCTIGVPVDTTEFSLEALIHENATISPANGTLHTMDASESTKTVVLTVTAEDNSVRDYMVIVERQKSSNTNLSDLRVDDVQVPNFAAGTQIYNVSVPGLTEEVTVSAEVEDTGRATITTDLSNKFILDFGPNQIDVEVKAENGDTKKYTIIVTRENGIDATLKDLKINGTTITGFAAETTEYTLDDVLYNTTSLNVTAIPNDENATASGDGLINLKTGENEIIITVTAHNPDVTKTYTIKVNREKNDDTGIQSITLADNLATYNSSTGKYEVTVPNSVNEANNSNVTVVVNDPLVETDEKATYTVTTTQLVTTSENNVPITVTAEDGTIKVYTLVVTRTKANIATLDSLTVTNGAFNPSFNKDTFEYSVTVPVDTTEFDITAVKTDVNSNITSGTNAEGTAHYTMTESTKTIQVVVTSEDLSVTNTYTLNITRTASSVNTLSDITVKNGETTYSLTPEFNSNTTEYTVNVEGNIDKVTIDATLTDDRAEILSGEGEHELEVGENTITIRVESESGAANAYTIKVIRAEKSDNNLTSLTVDGVEVPDFDPDTTTYTLDDVLYTKTSIEIGATLSDSDASITGTGKKGLKTGDNSFDIVVTAQNGDTKTYTINIKRAKNNNAKLQLLSINGFVLEPTFESTTYDYSVTVKSTKKTLSPDEITAVPEDTNATVKKQETITLSTTVDNFYTIEVTAEDGVTKESYTIQVIRPKSSDATLASVDLKGTATISPAFNPNTFEYTLTVPYGNTSFSIEGIPNVETTTVFGNGDFTTETDVVKITTQAEEDSSVLIYVFNVVEAASNDATLSNLSVTGYPFVDKTFQSTDLNYSIGNIPYSTTQLKIEATKTNANSTIQYYVDGSEQLSNIVSIPQVLGTKVITVRVTAADGVTTKDYNISYTVVNSANAYLSNIVPSIGEIEFNKTTFNYNNFTVENSVTSVDFTITTEDSNAKITVDGESFFTPKKITVSDLPVGTKTLTILVTAQDGSTTQTYNVVIRRQAPALSDDANLSSLSVEGYPLDKTFNMDTLEYSIGSIPFSVTELTINATPNFGSSTIAYSVNGVGQSDNVVTIPRVEGTGAITVKVTAEDGVTVKSYKITYSKTASTNAYLSNILVSVGSLDKEFNKNTFDYTVNVDRTISSIDITAMTEDQTATMKMNGVTYTSPHTLTISPLNSGNTELLILVTAENGNVITYKVTVNKEIDPASTITSVEYGHTITNGYIRTVKLATTAIDMKNQLDNENEYLEIWTADESRQVEDSETLATGMIVKLIIDGEEKDRKYIVIKGDTSGDGEIDLFDAVKILNHYLVRTPLTGAYLEAAYVNDDTDIDLFDSVMILNHYLGRISLH